MKENRSLFALDRTRGSYSVVLCAPVRLVLIFANVRPGVYSVVLIYISAEPVPIVLSSGI